MPFRGTRGSLEEHSLCGASQEVWVGNWQTTCSNSAAFVAEGLSTSLPAQAGQVSWGEGAPEKRKAFRLRKAVRAACGAVQVSRKGKREEKKMSLENCITDGREENGKGHKLQHAETANSHFHFSSITHIHTPPCCLLSHGNKALWSPSPNFNNFWIYWPISIKFTERLWYQRRCHSCKSRSGQAEKRIYSIWETSVIQTIYQAHASAGVRKKEGKRGVQTPVIALFIWSDIKADQALDTLSCW